MVSAREELERVAKDGGESERTAMHTISWYKLRNRLV
jgi:hypothetical protein